MFSVSVVLKQKIVVLGSRSIPAQARGELVHGLTHAGRRRDWVDEGNVTSVRV